MKYYLVCIAAGLASPVLAADESFRLLPESMKLADISVSASGAFSGDVDLKAGGQFSVSSYSFSVAQQVQLGSNEDNGFSVGFTYDRLDFDQTGRNARTPMPDQLQSLSVDLLYQHRLNERWVILGALSPRVANAGSSFGSDGFGVDSALVATWEFRPDLSFSLGGAFATLNGENEVFPVIGVNWVLNPQWRLQLGFPEASVVYTPLEQWSFALSAEGSAGTFYVEEDPAPGASGRPSLRDSTLVYEDIRLGVSATHQLTDLVSIKATVGYLLSGNSEYKSPDFKVKSDGGAVYGSLAIDVSF